MGYPFDKIAPYISENKVINTDHLKSFFANTMILPFKQDQETNKYSASLPRSVLRPSKCMTHKLVMKAND